MLTSSVNYDWWTFSVCSRVARVRSQPVALQWHHNDNDGVSNHQPHGCLLNRLFRRRSKKTSKLRDTGLCVGNSTGTGEFPAQRPSYAENVSIWWRHHGTTRYMCFVFFHSLSRSLVIWSQRSKRILVKLWNILHPSIHWCQTISHNLNAIGRYNDSYV